MIDYLSNFLALLLLLLFIERQKNALKKFDPRTWCTKKPFSYRVIHHGYSLMSCPEPRKCPSHRSSILKSFQKLLQIYITVQIHITVQIE